MRGVSIDYPREFNATKLIPLIEKYSIAIFCTPSTIYLMLIMADLKKYYCSKLRHRVSAEEFINREVIRTWKDATGLEIHEGYDKT